MTHNTDIQNRHLASYLTLRKGIGYLGLALPVVLGFGGMLFANPGLRSSVSAYYHTGLGDVLVGTICVIGIFLFAYKGYEPKDDWAGDFACFCAIGLPTAKKHRKSANGTPCIGPVDTSCSRLWR